MAPHHQTYSSVVYATHPEVQNPFVPRHQLSLDTDISAEITALRLYDLKDSGTQTSKTILQLVQQARDLSPDSLMQSPKDDDDYKESCEVMPQDQYSLDGSVVEHEQVDYEPSYYRQNFDDFRNSHESDPKMSLTETFLAKTKYKECTSSCFSGYEMKRSHFLNFMKKNSSTKLKSKSFVDSYQCNSPQEQTPKQRKFTVKQVRDRKEKMHVHGSGIPLKKTSPRMEPLMKDPEPSPKPSPRRRPRNRSSSFMSPTIASEQRNQLPEIQKMHMLLSPIRRGRSTSPKFAKTRHTLTRVPYIDESESGEVFGCDSSKSQRRYMHGVDVATAKISPPHNTLMFEEDLLRIDNLTLDIVSSDVTLKKQMV